MVQTAECPQGGDTKREWENPSAWDSHNHGQVGAAVCVAGIGAYL